MNSTYSNGETQPNHNDSMTQEVTVQTASPGAEVSGGGLFINLIPKEGGNSFSGSSFVGYTGSGFQGDNLTPELIAKGLTTGDGVEYIYDVNASLGGPIVQNKLWFFGSYRNVGNANIVANSFYPDGSLGLYDQDVQNYTVRLTWQAAAAAQDRRRISTACSSMSATPSARAKRSSTRRRSGPRRSTTPAR